MKKKILFTAFFINIVAICYCQNAEIILDTNHILIGDHVKMHLNIHNIPSSPILFPNICDTCIPSIEIVSRGQIDTINNNGQISLKQEYTITAFDSGNHIIPALTFYTTDSTIITQTVATILNVSTIKVDTNQAIKDITAPLKEPITFKEILPFILIILGLVLIIIGTIWLIRKYLLHRKNGQIAQPIKPLEPAEIIALRDLDVLWQKKLCEKGQYKEFYSSLSIITRTYIYHRWNIASLEMVTSEVFQALQTTPATPSDINNVKQVLETADLVKFAKAQVLEHENKANYEHIVAFVKNTTPVVNTKINEE